MGGAQAATRQRVLIVDDDRLLLAGMVSSQLDARVERAGTYEQALRLAEGQKPAQTAEVAAIIRKHMEGRSHA